MNFPDDTLFEIMKKFDCGLPCFENMMNKSINGDKFSVLEEILQENKENLNFVFIDASDPLYKTNENAYGILWQQKIPSNIYDILCVSCMWEITSKFNDKKGIPIYCGNH